MTKRKLLRGFIMTKCRQLFHLKAQQKETALSAVKRTLIPKDWRDRVRGREFSRSCLGAPAPSSEASPKVPGDVLSFQSHCPNLSRPVKPKTCDTGDCSQGQICVPRAPLWLPYFAKHTLERTAPGHPGNRPRSVTTATVAAQRPEAYLV